MRIVLPGDHVRDQATNLGSAQRRLRGIRQQRNEVANLILAHPSSYACWKGSGWYRRRQSGQLDGPRSWGYFLGYIVGHVLILAVARPLRRTQVENYIVASTQLPHSHSPIATSDASMLPSPASFLQARSITSAAATPDSWVAFSLASHGTSIYPVFTGHKNAVHFVLDVLPGALPHVWNGQPVHSLYRWQFHTRMSSLDHMASSVQHSGGVLASLRLRNLLWPDDYTIFTPSCGFIECNLSSFVVSRLEDAYASNDSFHPAQVMTLALYDRYLPPDFPYTRASSSFCAAVQLYARSSQLDTAQPSWLSAVRIACNSEETSLLEGKAIDHIREVFDRAARRLFSDDAGLWPQY
ncbi:hypothetical protein DFJ58DRAFT_911048 [Suillus subalutaceus]|uniref:uncharacterized protein n=1 Tax=Suillus subalutaceus TaxID=48586 RepID=UPI001B873615|nr:uncharacterized protein DFJ58DRAFT_911048 [Suillus subalutaceus]KAG1870712.1 hypothetical protein DFJ58DRAFT_911048 [Suillus subalutaceus]